MRVSVVGTNLPGRTFCRADGSPMNNVHVGVQRLRDPVSLVRADAAEARLSQPVLAPLPARAPVRAANAAPAGAHPIPAE